MQQVKILKDAENDKFIFINPVTKDKTNYDSLESLVDHSCKPKFRLPNVSVVRKERWFSFFFITTEPLDRTLQL